MISRNIFNADSKNPGFIKIDYDDQVPISLRFWVLNQHYLIKNLRGVFILALKCVKFFD